MLAARQTADVLDCAGMDAGEDALDKPELALRRVRDIDVLDPDREHRMLRLLCALRVVALTRWCKLAVMTSSSLSELLTCCCAEIHAAPTDCQSGRGSQGS